MTFLRYLVTTVMLCALAVPVYSQDGTDSEDGFDFTGQLESLVETNAEGYVKPLATSTGIGLNGGVYRTAKVHKLFGFDLSVNVSGIMIPDSAKYYTFDTSALGSATQDVAGTSVTLDLSQLYPSVPNAPTFFGSEETPELDADETYAREAIVSQIAQDQGLTEDQVNAEYGDDIETTINDQLPSAPVPPGVFDQGFWAVPSAQASVGLPFGTEVNIRYVPPYNLGEEIGELSLFGIGGRISIDQFIPIPFFPLDIATGAFFQNIELGPVNINSNIVHAEISKSLPVFTLYGGVGLESSTLSASYTYDDPVSETPRDIEISVKGDNNFRGTVGLRMQLLILAINADYNFAPYNSVNLGVGLSFR